MASNAQHWSDGFGGTAGDAPIATAKDIYVYSGASTRVYFVYSGTGSNSNDGTRDDPYATFAYAASLAGAGDVIVILSGHTESITADIALSARIIVIGEGAGNNRPAFTPATAGAEITITAPCHFHGLRFLAATATYTTAQIIATAAGAIGTRFNHCAFTSGDKEGSVAKLAMNNSGSFLDNCTFTSSGSTYDLRPYGPFTDCRLVRDCTINGNTYGWRASATFLFGWGNTASGPVGIGGTYARSVIQCVLTADAYFDTTATPDYHIYTEGLGLTGHPLLSGAGLFVSGGSGVGQGSGGNPARISYVNSVGGTDSGSNGWGRSYKRPYATLKYAINTATSTGLVVVAAGHAETVTAAAIAVDDGGVIIVGEGNGDARAAITRNWDGILVDCNSADGIGICNLRFPISGTSTATATISVRQVGVFVERCELKLGANDTGAAVTMTAAGDSTLIDACTFLSAITAAATAPGRALTTVAGTANTIVLGCTFDGGQYGWSSGQCAYIYGGTIYVDNLTLIRDSIFVLTGYAGVEGNGVIEIDAFAQVELATGTSGILSKPQELL